MKLVVREESEQDIRAAMTWYAAQRPGLELEFLTALSEVFTFLLRWPENAQRITRTVRSFPMERFPYAIIHGTEQDTLVIIRVFHQHRNPKTRLRSRRKM